MVFNDWGVDVGRYRGTRAAGVLGVGITLAAGLATAPGGFAAAPAAPLNANAATVSRDLTVNQSLPDGGAAVTSTITVSGAQPVLRDVDLITAIPHSSSGDLTITLTSPHGTTVLLTDVTIGYYTGQPTGRTDANWFNGVTWDDSAGKFMADQPLNDGGASAGTLGSVVPEGAMGAFIGEDPNGVWTLTVRDALANAATGKLASWGLRLATMDAPAPSTLTTVGSTTVTAITDGNGHPATTAAVTNIPLQVAGVGTYLLDVDMKANVEHDYSSDLAMYLVSPKGTVIPLVTRVSDVLSGSKVGIHVPTDFARLNIWNGTLWNDSAPVLESRIDVSPGATYPIPTLVPVGAMAAVVGENPNGTWTLRILDWSGGPLETQPGIGRVRGWNLRLTTTNGFPAPTPTPTPTPQPPPPGTSGTLPPVTISAQARCATPATPPAVRRLSVARTPASFAAVQRVVRTQLAREQVFEAWLNAGITTGDLCGGAFGQADLTVPSGAGTSVQQLTQPSPRPVRDAVRVTTTRLGSAGVTRLQARKLNLQARSALIRAKALQTRVNGGLTGGDLADGAVTTDKLNAGLVVTAPTGATTAASTTNAGSVRVALTPPGASIVAQMLAAERNGRAAAVILNALRAKLQAGLTGADFRDGTVGAAKLG